jgi:GH24 family phage-related lysozyme (muramidase)
LDRNKIVNTYLKNHLQEVEGHSDEVYDDQKGIPTVGRGISLRSPSSQESLLRLGYDPDSVQRGEVSLSNEELDQVENDIINQKRDYLNTIKSQSFPQKEFNEAQEAAMLSLMYNSPQLVGPKLRQFLNEGKDLDVMREIVLNSNRENSPGLQLRRIKEAELYGGPLDFQNMLKTMTPQEKAQVYQLLNKIDNEEQRNSVLEKYGQFNPDYQPPMEKPKFGKIANIFKGK